MHEQSTTLAAILSEKKELLRLFIIATFLAFSVGVLASLVAAQTIVPVWALYVTSAIVAVASLALLALDLRASLSFEDRINAVIFIDPRRNELLRVRDYEFSEDLERAMSAVKAENRSIYAEWESGPLIQFKEASEPKTEEELPATDKRSYIGIFKVTVNDTERKLPAATRLLEEVVSFVLLDELSTHLSMYFNDVDEDQYISELSRGDIPGFLLQNRVLNLLSTPIEQRDIFLNAFPNKEERPRGVLYSLWGSDGAMYSRFDLVLPRGTVIRHSEVGTFRIETQRLVLEISGKYSDSSAVVSPAFVARYMGRDPDSVECRKIHILVKCKIKPLSLITSKGWQYYRWLDSFRQTLRDNFDFETFQSNIHWQIIEPLLYAMRGQRNQQRQEHVDPKPQKSKPKPQKSGA